MIDQIAEVLEQRHRQIVCLFQCVNLNLVVVSRALSGDKELSTRVHEIGGLLQDAYLHHRAGDERYHSFVVAHYFISLVSEFEGFLVDVLRIIVRKFPSKIGNVSLKVSEIASCANLDQAIEIGVNRFLNELVYKRPKEYIAAINEIVSAPKSPELDNLWAKFIECKARRDIGVHNGWKVNEIYIRKLNEVAEIPPKTEFIAPDNDYFVASVKVIHNLMTRLAKHCIDKFGS